MDGSSVVLREVISKADGSKMLGAVYHFATRSDGSSVFVGTHDPASVEAPVRMIRFASGSQGYISDAKRQKHIYALAANGNPAAPQNLRVPSSSCTLASAGETASGEEEIGEYRAEKVAGKGRSSWYALDFGCALVKEHLDWGDGSTSDKYLVMLRPGEPERWLFEVPSAYKDVPRSAFEY